jgi:hypothetical protein
MFIYIYHRYYYTHIQALTVFAYRVIIVTIAPDGSYMKFYQSKITAQHPNIAKYEHVLRNIQNCYNAVRLDRRKDELEEITDIYTDGLDASNAPDEESKEPTFDIDFGLLDEADDQDEGQALFHEFIGSPFSIVLDTIRNYGEHQCGYEFLTLPIPLPGSLNLSDNANRSPYSNINSNASTIIHNNERMTRTRLVELKFRTDTSRRIKPQSTTAEEMEMIKPNGTKPSIEQWGEFYGLDENQRGAFEVAASNFVLTYHQEADLANNQQLLSLINNETESETTHLELKADLVALGAKPQLLMFMTGAGGAGKSNVIEALIEYCKEFCANLGVHFDSQTLIITAMTGVAATSIMGQTSYTALGILKKGYDSEFIKSFEGTRMVLIDEISFCSAKVLGKLDKALRIVKQEPDLTYGGLHIIFAGDFHQLPPIGQGNYPIWQNTEQLWHCVLNSFIELKGKWRFVDDPEWGELLARLRLDELTEDDLLILKSRVISPKYVFVIYICIYILYIYLYIIKLY